ncbi:MAG: polymer-forming cytoskeletal protein [Akkermansiaceae bacterium]
MPLFKRKNRSNNDEGDQMRRKNAVELSCPECGFEQNEPNIAVSTYCRGCSTHYKIEEGKAVAKPVRPSNPFASLRGSATSPKLRNQASTDTPAIEQKKSGAKVDSSHPTEAAPKKPFVNNSIFQPKSKQRSVSCFECEHIHQAPTEASSTLCPSCGGYIALKNYDIRDNWNRGIQTRGNVTIHKKAAVTGITIRCHDLTVLGKLTGGVDCSGDFVIQSHGKIMGKVRCKRLIIEKRAHVEFSNPVQCEDAIIDGDVTGNFTCSGKLHLKKKATLNGDIKVATMAVDEGARHHGQISIGQ